MTVSWFKNDELFFSELKKGRKYELYIAILLLDMGFTVSVPRLCIRKEFEEINKFSESQGDVFVSTGDKMPIILEVKSRDLEFTSVSDYPYDSIFVDTKSSWEKKSVKPRAIVIVSQKTGASIVVSSKTKEFWEEVKAHDHIRDIDDTWYSVHGKHTKTFNKLTKWLSDAVLKMPRRGR